MSQKMIIQYCCQVHNITKYHDIGINIKLLLYLKFVVHYMPKKTLYNTGTRDLPKPEGAGIYIRVRVLYN